MRYIDRFDALLLDMGETFMFGCDRFSASENFGATYRHLSGSMLNHGTVRDLVLGVFAEVEKDYYDPACYASFPPLRSYLAAHPLARDLPDSEQDLVELVFAHHEIGWVPDTYRDALIKLRTTHRLGIVSNIWGRSDLFYECFDQAGLRDLFDVLLFSSDHGMVKPTPLLFQKAIDALGLPASDIAFVGDDLRCDVEGAQAAGIPTIWINKNPNRQSDLPDRTITDLCDLLVVQ